LIQAMPARLLVVEDDPSVRRSLAEMLAEEGFAVETATSAEQALGLLGDAAPDVILSDVRMPGMSGLELLKLLRERLPAVDVILMTAYEDMPTVARAMREGAFDFLVKPLRLAELRAVLARVLEDRRSRDVARRSVEEDGEAYGLETLVGRDPSMIEVYKRVGQVAAGRVNALVLGETGSGKERVARAIHHHSADSAEPFIAVNCTALPEALLESELFGHVKGAFTGAVADRRGRFALAGRGTIFLDEIGDTSAAFQAKLLRVLEDREFYPVGAERPERTEARVLAATHHDLEARVAAGDFREDLYYRLRVVEIRIPPLRDRLGDLPLLARHFVQKIARDLHRPPATLPDETLAVLLRYHWPGNVRELENCLARAAVLASGNVIRPEHLGIGGADESAELTGELPDMSEMERIHLERALATAGGNRTRAAELLGMSRPRLYRLLHKHDLA
jgi:two-component system, NtrC family, response regulator AtoC